MKRITVAALLFLLFAGMPRAQEKDSADLKAYLDEIRASGASEGARSAVRMIAGISSGATILEYRLDEASGRYWPSYMSATCPNPNATNPELEQWKLLRRSETDILSEKLKPFADADQSGFVTTQEADEFRSLIEFGYLVAQVNRDEGTSVALVARASGLDEGEAKRRVDAYQALALRIRNADVTELPEVTLLESPSRQ